MKIVICEDNEVQLLHAHRLTETCLGAGHSLLDFHTADALQQQLQAGLQPDIAILDVELGRSDGISLARQINALCPRCQIIFLTAFPRYAQEAYHAEHTWLVLKNDAEQYLPQALKKATARLTGADREEQVLLVKVRHAVQRIPVSQVLYIERVSYHARVVTLSGEVLSTQKPDALLGGVPEGTFVWCHQSFWVNVSKIVSRTAASFILIDGTAIPISRTRRQAALCAFQG